MLCHQARKRLADHNWRSDAFGQDKELLAHLKKCPKCYGRLLAENTLDNDLAVIRRDMPANDLPLSQIKTTAEANQNTFEASRSGFAHSLTGFIINLLPGRRYRYAIGIIAIIFGFMAFVPFNFREKAGYEIAIAGVDKNIAEDNQEITSLLCALGMEKDKSSAFNDSLDIHDIRLNVGECRETCYLTISDLKSEKDMRFVVKTIIELGCCQIDKIIPVFRIESSSLLRHVAKKLFS